CSDQDVFSPMAAEMARSLSRLRLKPYGPPYFIAYRVVDERRAAVSAAFGSLVSRSRGRRRHVFVELRYGERAFDNTELGYEGRHGEAGFAPAALRESLWQLTDQAYKDAVSGYLEKRAERLTRYRPEKLDDFSAQAATRCVQAQAPPELELKKAGALAERLSAVFRRYPYIYDGRAAFQLSWSRRYLLTSEGTRLAGPEENVPSSLDLWAVTRAPDGMLLTVQKRWMLRRLSDLPPERELLKAADALARGLMAERLAPAQAPAAAPAILDPEMTGVLFHEALGHKLEGQRQRDPKESQIFRDLVGKRIIPPFLSLRDDPTLPSFDGQPLHGFYRFDDEGVPAQRVVLVDRGVLRNFLMSRWPVRGFPFSNGHGRADADHRPTGRMANLMVVAERPVGRRELKRRLMALAREEGKPYGFLLVGAFGGENPNARKAAQTLEVRPRRVYRVDAKTGAQTLVRGVSLVGTPLALLNRIVAAGDDETLANGFFCGAESGVVPVDQIAPSVLISSVELQRLPEDLARPPILPSPFGEPEASAQAKAVRP
ncbi:MAG: TldD/PmbA family protein, partial [Elusimicrobia bacterium]|nr:TldD/PmbA family protein [Elusimicrobiota bacterium]